MEKRYWVYIITDKPYGTLYVGVTNDLARRIWEHKTGMYVGFSKRYGLKLLVYHEEYARIEEAIQREKQIKKWRRDWKIDLIHKVNHRWKDCGEGHL
ncbi:MAG: GIY-YIG nuclease family protein [Alphaproteobacteria bacterium]|nr:GIY-YIG nuclease family protein [Alphaproteobacteria bacterium]